MYEYQYFRHIGSFCLGLFAETRFQRIAVVGLVSLHHSFDTLPSTRSERLRLLECQLVTLGLQDAGDSGLERRRAE